MIVEKLNLGSVSTLLPKEFEGFYDAQKYKKSQKYLKEQTKFGLSKDAIFTGLIVIFILCGGFNFVDSIARGFRLNPIFTGLAFAGILLLALQILGIPFSIYHTFVIEEKYGFNKTTPKTFILDILKSWALLAIIGGTVFAGVLWFFAAAGKWAWVYCWAGVTLFQLFLAFIAPVVILPIFNKFTPLEDGELKKAIEEYAKKENFKMKGVFKVDASRRSTKSNAFFIGFGRFRRIGLFDTLIEKHTVPEIVSVLAHEIGHYKKRHYLKNLLLSIISSGLMFFILSFFINNPGLFAAFKMQNLSIYASFVFFGFLYTPINMIFSILASFLSRRREHQADKFAVTTYHEKEAFITSLKKLTVDNLGNLTPHPLKVFLEYSHPPILKRIEAIRGIVWKLQMP